jgi:hypothetical protein
MALRADPLTATRRQRARLGPLGWLAVAEVPKRVDVRYSPVTDKKRFRFQAALPHLDVTLRLRGRAIQGPDYLLGEGGEKLHEWFPRTWMLKTMLASRRSCVWLQLS